MNLPFQPPIAPMEAKHVDDLPVGDAWRYEPKWDGFRAVCFHDATDVYISSRGEQPFARYFPELVEGLAALSTPRVVLDGEIVVFTPDGRGLDFDALLQRIHPAASRVARLARETPASFVAFDVLAVGDDDLRDTTLSDRRATLDRMLDGVSPPLYLSPWTPDRNLAATWLTSFVVAGLDGVVAKRDDAPYRSGEREMLKVKRERTADCVVMGFRWAKDQRGEAVGSLLLGLYDDDGVLEHIGVVSSLARRTRLTLASELAALVAPLAGHPWEHGFLTAGGATGRLKGAAGRWVPGMTMDWIPLAPGRVCEVAYTQVDGHRLRHPAKLVRWRPDREPESCRLEQLATPVQPVDQVLSVG